MLALALSLMACPAALQLADDFSTPGPPAPQRWRTVAGRFEARDGLLHGYRSDTSWLVWRGMVAPTRLRAEVTLTPTGGSRPGAWGACGVAAYLDNGNYWRLALVESASDKDMRYCELVEKCQGTWQAQAAGDTALETVGTEGEGGWQLGRTYRLVLELDAQRCSGTVLEGDRVLWRRVYAMPEVTTAVRSGWPALTVVDMEVDFADMRADADQLALGSREGPPKALVVHNDLPGAAPAVEEWARAALAASGLQVEVLPAQQVAAAQLTGADYDVMVLPSAQVTPVGLAAAVSHYLSRGGSLMVLATGVPFERQLTRVGDEWITPAEAQARVPSLRPVLDIAPDLPDTFVYASNDPAAGKSVTVEPAPAETGGRALHFTLDDFSGWNTWGTPLKLGSVQGDAPVMLFWAKGDEQATHLIVEVNEEDGSRWIAVAPVTTYWRRLALAPDDFKYWRDSPEAARRGFAGDRVNPESLVEIRFGLANSHAPLARGPKDFWVASVSAGPLLAQTERRLPPEMDAVSPWYKTFEYPSATRLETADGTVWPRVSCAAAGVVRCAHARPWGRVMTGVRGRRWVPILEASDPAGHHSYVAAAVLRADGPFAGASWSWWGLSPEVLAASGNELAPLFADVARAHVRRLWLLEAGPDQVAYLDGARPRWGARLLNVGSTPASVEVRLSATGPGGPARALDRRLEVAPMSDAEVSEEWPVTAPGLYDVTVELRVGDQVVDRIATPARMVKPQPAAETLDKFVRVEGGMFVRGGRPIRDKSGTFLMGGTPWFAHGVNFWPRYVAGLAPEDYGLGWQTLAHYDPVLVEEDLAIAESVGITAVSIQPPRAADDLPCLWDFLERAAAHGIYTNLFIPVDPRGFDADYVRSIVEGGRLADFWALYAYDITWEPRFGQYDERKRWDPRWQEWVEAQYGSIAAAEKAWGIPAPRDEAGALTGPTDQQLAEDGDWRVMVAAYRRFVDDFLSAGYGRSCRFLHSLDRRHLISNRAGWGGTGNLHTVRPYQFDPLSGGAHLDFISPEAYGMTAEEGDYRRWGFVDAYCRWAGNGKPVFWSEFGNTIHPGYKPDDYERQRRIWENSLQLVLFAGADGDAGWWWPGGFRVGENSDYGCTEPWGEPRPSALQLKEFAPRLCTRGPDDRPEVTLTVDRDADVRGLPGLWQKHLDEYLAAADGRHAVRLKTEGDGKTTVDFPLAAVGNAPYTGFEPPRHVNSELTEAVVRVGESVCRAADDFLWHDVALEVPAGKPARVELAWLNTGVVEWACATTAGDRAGAVVLTDVATGKALAALPHDVARYGTATFRFELDRTPAAGEERVLTLRLEAKGRCRFGQQIRLTLRSR